MHRLLSRSPELWSNCALFIIVCPCLLCTVAAVYPSRRLFDGSEHEGAGFDLWLPILTVSGRNKIFSVGRSKEVQLSFAQLIYISGDFVGPNNEGGVLCLAKDHQELRRRAQQVLDLWSSSSWVNKNRINKIQHGVEVENNARGSAINALHQKPLDIHAAVHAASYDTIETFDVINVLKWNLDHFGYPDRCAEKAYQVFHDMALEKAAQCGNEIWKMQEAYFIEGLGFHFLTDLFSSGHMRTPSISLRTDVCDGFRGGFAANMQHDEDSYNGLYVTNRRGDDPWWAYGDSFYWEDANERNKAMMHTAMQESLNEVAGAFKSGSVGTGHSNRSKELPGKGLDYAPDIDASIKHMGPEFWDANTCPLFIVDGGSLHRRTPWVQLRTWKGPQLSDPAPSTTRFGLWTDNITKEFASELVEGDKLRKGSCEFVKVVAKTGWFFAGPFCGRFGLWPAEGMFYNPQAAGFLPPQAFATCDKYSEQAAFNNVCTNVHEFMQNFKYEDPSGVLTQNGILTLAILTLLAVLSCCACGCVLCLRRRSRLRYERDNPLMRANTDSCVELSTG